MEIIYLSSRNSKETGEIFRILPRKSARGIRPLDVEFPFNLILLIFLSEMDVSNGFNDRPFAVTSKSA